MIPTGSWPTVNPGSTGYSPFRMWTSVPQIVVVVILISASSGPTSGTGLSSSTMRLTGVQLLDDGRQVVCLPGATLDVLEGKIERWIAGQKG